MLAVNTENPVPRILSDNTDVAVQIILQPKTSKNCTVSLVNNLQKERILCDINLQVYVPLQELLSYTAGTNIHLLYIITVFNSY